MVLQVKPKANNSRIASKCLQMTKLLMPVQQTMRVVPKDVGAVTNLVQLEGAICCCSIKCNNDIQSDQHKNAVQLPKCCKRHLEDILMQVGSPLVGLEKNRLEFSMHVPGL